MAFVLWFDIQYVNVSNYTLSYKCTEISGALKESRAAFIGTPWQRTYHTRSLEALDVSIGPLAFRSYHSMLNLLRAKMNSKKMLIGSSSILLPAVSENCANTKILGVVKQKNFLMNQRHGLSPV